MSTTTPTWADYVSVVASATLARGSTARGTLDLSAKFGAWLLLRIGRQGTTALTNGVDILVRRILNNSGTEITHPGSVAGLNSGFTAALSTTCATSDSASGQPVLNVASSTSFVAGDLILIGGGTAREEWKRVSKVAAGVLTLDSNLEFTHTTAQADTVRSQAFCPPPVWMPGGSRYEVIFDYGDDTAGESVTVEARAQRYENDSTA